MLGFKGLRKLDASTLLEAARRVVVRGGVLLSEKQGTTMMLLKFAETFVALQCEGLCFGAVLTLHAVLVAKIIMYDPWNSVPSVFQTSLQHSTRPRQTT